MRSGELASLAQVTVRTLRHYERLGVLAAPDRGGNGYRAYSVHHLIRVIRLRTLTGLGFELVEAAAMLDAEPDVERDALGRLDTELAGRIRRLEAQRDVIRRLRESGQRADLPPELRRVGEGGPVMERYDREQTVLLAHLAGPAALSSVVRAYETIGRAEQFGPLEALIAHVDALGADADGTAVDQLADALVAAMRPLVAELGDDDLSLDLRAVESLFAEHAADVLNPAQRRVLDAVTQRLGEG